ncbi:hypothetical protein AYO20_06227 [Fonsecaea nubica]|uniref:Cytochrome P450 n=1 Tax=Fonsecaea nubica TaxID=856822 RepID=A0A178CYR9_9EURO|nr:hypothetical protein AYO20_06227 [Fonsecaea nubica]OAL34597.1 hypothetical protein AYO20_06227 [Fonsecaea nubica]
MATSYRLRLSPCHSGFVHTQNELSLKSAETTETLLMQNHEQHHIYFDNAGLHNHIVHHLLCIYSLGASASQLEKAYRNNTEYQIPPYPADPATIETLSDQKEFAKYLGNCEHYRDYVVFFKKEISKRGVEAVVNEYVFRGDARADDMLARMFSGFLHPIIHLGYGLEFNQPMIVAEALAQAAIHEDWPGPFLWGAEAEAKNLSKPAGGTLVEILDEIRANTKLANSVEWPDPPNKVTDGLYKRAADEMIRVAARWQVAPEELEQKTAEMINAGLYMTALAQRADKAVKFDFFFMHCANTSYFFSVFNQMPWISTQAKARIVECMGRLHLLMYASAKGPKLRPQDLNDYRPEKPGGWESIFARAAAYEDDGHTSKLIRAIKNGEITTAGFEEAPGIKLKTGDFLKIAHMVMDSVEAMDRPDFKMPNAGTTGYEYAAELDPFVQRVVVRWLRWAGFPEAWEAVAERNPRNFAPIGNGNGLSNGLSNGMRPPTLPIIGNLHQMTARPYQVFDKLAKEYGPIFSLKLGTQTMVVLNTEETIRDLFEKRSANYSSKPGNFVAEFGNNWNLLFRPNDDLWRRFRKMYHLRLNVTAANRYIPYQEFESLQLLNEMMDGPHQFWDHVKRYTTSIGSTVTYGHRTPLLNTPTVKTLFEWLDRFSILQERSQLADWYPILKPLFLRLPSWVSGFLKEASELRDMERGLWTRLIKQAIALIDEGKMHPSFSRDMLLTLGAESEKIDKADALSEEEIAFAAGHAWTAAADTTYSTLMGFIKAMILFPEVQRAAQEEIDRVVGSHRLPCWDDSPNMPYTMAVVRESVRWMPTTIGGGVPHATTHEDFYMGYRIPAGAAIVNNAWTINNDRTNPRQFDPIRHLPGKYPTVGEPKGSDLSDRPFTTFGAGRRMCPGIHVAERSMFTAMSRFLWAFEMSRPRDENGNMPPLDPDALTPGFLVMPIKYDAVFKVRSKGRGAIIRREWADASKMLDENGDYTEAFFEQSFAT